MGDVADSPHAPEADFTLWVRPHVRAMAALAARLTSTTDRDDVVQESLTAAWRKFEQYDPGRGQPSTWLLAIVADQARKATRRRRGHYQFPEDGTPHQHVDHVADPDVERAIGRLPERQRLAVSLYYFLDLPVADVAAVMRCSPGTVKATLSHARGALRKHLGEDF